MDLQTQVNRIGILVLLPLSLVLNLCVLQYLVMAYHRRWREWRALLLLLSAFIAFAVMLPYAHPNHRIRRDCNRIAELSLVLTFLAQVAIVGRDVNKKLALRKLQVAIWGAEALMLIGACFVILGFLEMGYEELETNATIASHEVVENVALWYIFIFRGTMLLYQLGGQRMMQTKQLEMFVYLLMVTHQYPFYLLEKETGLQWHNVETFWNRLTISTCILRIATAKGMWKSIHGLTSGPSDLTRDSSPTPPSQFKTMNQLTQVVPMPPVKPASYRTMLSVTQPSLPNLAID